MVDLLIVGSGAAGSLLAAKGAAAGKSVLVLEAGPERRLSDLISSQIHARKLKWGGAYVEEQGNHKIGHPYNAGWGTGGGTIHHFAVWPRLHPVDFSAHSTYGVGLDWPINYEELRPFYDRIQSEVGLSGDAKLEKWRPPGADYPMPGIPTFPQGQLLAQGFERLGLNTAPIPLAINSQKYHKRPSCLYDGWCEAGCPIGALANALTTYLPEALAKSARIKHQATVTRVLTNKSGTRVTGVNYCDNKGKRHIQYAEVVILAAFTIQNPRLLLASVTDKHPDGLGNNNNLVGAYLMTHPANSTYGLFKEETAPDVGVTGGQLINQDSYDNKTAIKGAFGGYQWLIANALKPNGLLGIANTRPDIYGTKLVNFMRRSSKHMANMIFVGDDIPQIENRVTLSNHKDSHGVPLAKTTHNLKPTTIQMTEHANIQGKRIFTAAGAQEIWQGPRVAMHLMGGTVMGDNENNSVTNSYGQVHGINNLFVAGPGLFPTSGAVNPTFTIHALALRTADFLSRHWSAITQ